MNQDEGNDVILEVRNICKHFGKVQALDDVSLAFRRGEIHTLLGENGAGKTTLMNIIYGLYHKDSGEILVEGEPREIRDPRDALQLGIGMVPQFFKLVQDMTVVENVGLFLRENRFLVRKRELEDKVRSLSDLFGFGLEDRLDAEIIDLSEGEKQKVEILKVLALGSRIILFDEATNVLAPNELDSFERVIKDMNREGYTILFITHRLQEALEVSDRISVFRKGKLVETLDAKEADYNRLTMMMVGAEFAHRFATVYEGERRPVLSVSGLSVLDDRGLPALCNVSFELFAGEIAGVAAIEGNGSSQLAEVLMGLRQAQAGEVRYRGSEITSLPCHARMRRGMNYIPSANTLVPLFSIRKNSILDYPEKKPFSSHGILNWREVGDHAEKIVATYNVQTPGIHLPAVKLSGGNRQRLALGRKIEACPMLMIAYHPTKGLDVSSQEFFYSKLAEMTLSGATILFMGTDLDELYKICNRLFVLYRGEIAGVFEDLAGVSKIDVGVLMTGGATYAKRATDD
ncbi:MAG: ATP-binding cassette domain-containing protein [Spirochaetales bacterium]|nr:ATP-binding cassette domain-containing protein [Spirochaetales bacterium]